MISHEIELSSLRKNSLSSEGGGGKKRMKVKMKKEREEGEEKREGSQEKKISSGLFPSGIVPWQNIHRAGVCMG